MGEALEGPPPVFVGETLEHVLAAAAGKTRDQLRGDLARELERQRDVVAFAPNAWREQLRERVATSRLKSLVAPLKMLTEDVAAFARGALERTPAVEAVESFLEGGDRRSFLLLLGPVGTGKTLAATAGAAAPLRRAVVRWLEELDARDGDAWARAVGDRALFAASSAELVLEAIRGSRPRPTGRRLALWRASELPRLWEPWSGEVGATPGARDVDVLVLDDLGVEASSPRFDVALGELLEHRASSGRKTIITANLRPSDMRARYGDRVADRFNHLARVELMRGPSRRRKGAL